MGKTRYEIHDRIYQFVLLVLDQVKEIPKTTENLVLIKQVIRSAASIGANTAEADAAESKKEFVHRFIIAKKEAQETEYWLKFLNDHNRMSSASLLPLIQETRELIAIISKIVINSQKNSQR